MTTQPNTWTHRLGRRAGHGWRWLVLRDRQAERWLVAHGVPTGGAKALLWLVKLVLLGGLLYAAFWLALLLLFVVVVAWSVRDAGVEAEEWAIGEQAEYKQNPGYDPINYDDTPDPRFADPRFDDD
ncbi:hypothetical protein C1H69_10195 [Billgrantia endophytica]|uniref:DUF3742 domain-containing protein n=2 Tax=Billgrantia endophytica TaxID=2033802 RepID=A0A2N7U4E3_9GAMM|nr:hypothetical protein C1H69_10195 [Halomonas endophytica]